MQGLKMTTALVWKIISPSGVLHTVRGEAGLRLLCQEEKLPYDKLAKHVQYKEVKLPEKRQTHVKGWRSLRDCHWLRRGDAIVCVVCADAKAFITFVNSSPAHPMYGHFDVSDQERLTHLPPPAPSSPPGRATGVPRTATLGGRNGGLPRRRRTGPR